MNTELNTLKSLSVEELEYYLGVMANPDVPTTGVEIPGAYHRKSNSMHEFSQENLGTPEFRGTESLPDLPGRTEHLSTSEIIALGKSFCHQQSQNQTSRLYQQNHPRASAVQRKARFRLAHRSGG